MEKMKDKNYLKKELMMEPSSDLTKKSMGNMPMMDKMMMKKKR